MNRLLACLALCASLSASAQDGCNLFNIQEVTEHNIQLQGIIDSITVDTVVPMPNGSYEVQLTNDVLFSLVLGCTNPAYTEYLSTANADNGSCLTPVIAGCTDPAYIEYDTAANTDNGSCQTPIVEGCLDEANPNYNPLANTEDGSCLLESGECGLFISEAGEGSSNNKYIELFNPTDSGIALDNYTFGNCSNGCDALGQASSITGNVDYWTFSFPTGDQVPAGETYIVAHPSADPFILNVANMTYTYLSNGDDAYFLVSIAGGDTTVVDAVGDFGADPGSGFAVAGQVNATQNSTLVRKPEIFSGNQGEWSISAGTSPADSEWTIHPSNDWTNIGSHAIDANCSDD